MAYRKRYPKFILSPYKHIMYGGKKRASISFSTRKAAVAFAKKRRLKKSILLVRKY